MKSVRRRKSRGTGLLLTQAVAPDGISRRLDMLRACLESVPRWRMREARKWGVQ
jgi:hypothetical protein